MNGLANLARPEGVMPPLKKTTIELAFARHQLCPPGILSLLLLGKFVKFSIPQPIPKVGWKHCFDT
jgi:hypothetical protein